MGALEEFNHPDVFITEADYQALSRLAVAAMNELPGARLLVEELDRATLLPSAADVRFVKLGSLVEFQDAGTGRITRVRVCHPKEADMHNARVSVLAPVGAALLGLTVGSRFQWTGPDDRVRELKILRVDDPALGR